MQHKDRRPRLRTSPRLDAVTGANGEPSYSIQGLNGATGRALLIPKEAAELLPWLDGTLDVATICARYTEATGVVLPLSVLDSFIDELDQLHLIAWTTPAPSQVREPRFMASYLGRGELLTRNLTRLLASPPPPALPGALRALISPHIDLHRGRDGYRDAYNALQPHPPADLYVILGTSHQATRDPFVATEATYRTPYGDLEVDRDLLEAIRREYGEGLLRNARLHNGEHSIEFQALFLAFLNRCAPRQPRILPILCASLHNYMTRRTRPSRASAYNRFIRILREHLATYPGRVCIIAGVDMAHNGPQFGDPRGLTLEDQRALRARDLETLDHVCALDPEAFWDDVTRDNNQRNICGLAPIYATLHLLKGETLEAAPLHYGQAVDQVGNVVSYGAVGVFGS